MIKPKLTAVDVLEQLIGLWPGIDPNRDNIDVAMADCSELISDLSFLLSKWGGK